LTEDKANSTLFKILSQDLLAAGLGFRFRARGMSMQPTIRDGEVVWVEPVCIDEIRKRDIILFSEGSTFRAHRVLKLNPRGGLFHTRGDAGIDMDTPVQAGQILGRVVAKEPPAGKVGMIPLRGHAARARFVIGQLRTLVSTLASRAAGETGRAR
jgi:signal peptidase I